MKQEVFIVKIDEKLAGVSIYETKYKSYYFRLSCVHPDHRPGLIGYMLASTQPESGKNYLTWIDDNNLEAIKLNTFLGYKEDGTKNYIFVKTLLLKKSRINEIRYFLLKIACAICH